jgi:hypothetical protein
MLLWNSKEKLHIRRRTLKRVLVILLFLSIASAPAFAINNIYIDGYGAMVGNNDAESQYGGGFLLGYNVTGELSFVYRNYFTSTSKKLEGEFKDYSYDAHLVGVEYLKSFGRLGWRSQALVGYTSVDFPYVYNTGVYDNYSESGLGLFVETGLQYDLTQHISPFVTVGYHYDMYSKEYPTWNTATLSEEDNSVKINGLVFNIGVRFVIGENRSIDSDY